MKVANMGFEKKKICNDKIFSHTGLLFIYLMCASFLPVTDEEDLLREQKLGETEEISLGSPAPPALLHFSSPLQCPYF
jgi:hypothetical protein